MDPLPAWTTNADLHGELTNRQIAALTSARALTRVRRGSYVQTAAWTALSDSNRGRLRVRVIANGLGPRAVMSHTSAALLHGLPVVTLQTARPHVTWPGSPGRASSTNVIPHRAHLADEEIVIVDGVRTTSIGRTLFDLARIADVRIAVAAADVALRRNLLTRGDLQSTLERTRGRPGAVRAGQVFEFADDGAESVGESMARVQLRQVGVPRPDLQAQVVTAAGSPVARVDFLIRALGTVIEFDGRVKYEKFVRPGERAADVVYREKVREDAIRATGLEVVRLTWRDLSHDAHVLALCAAAFERQSGATWAPSTPGLVAWPVRLR